jgi:hypothetical protein
MGEQIHRAALLKGGVRDGTYKFLVSMLSFEFLYGTTLLEGQPSLSLILGGGAAEADHKLHVPKDSIRHEGFPEQPALPISGILFTGNLKTCVIEKSDDLAEKFDAQPSVISQPNAPAPSIS